MTQIASGYCDPKFNTLKEILEESVASNFEIGGSVALEVEGEMVVNLWNGWSSPEKDKVWKENTLVNVFSTTKGLAGTCLLKLIEKKLVDLEAPVSKYWPEFNQFSKEGITIEHILCHRAGLCGISTTLPKGAFQDWKLITKKLEMQEPLWEPGAHQGYHALTYGHLVGEILRRVDGRTIGKFFQEEIANPLELDFFIGLPESEFKRTADMSAMPTSNRFKWIGKLLKYFPTNLPFYSETFRFMVESLKPESLIKIALGNPEMEGMFMNTSSWRTAEIPAANGHGTAKSLAKFYGVLANNGKRGDVTVLEPSTLDLATSPHSKGPDKVLFGLDIHFGLGFMLRTDILPMGPSSSAFGHGGAGGSLAFGDRENKVGFAYVLNRMHSGLTTWKTASALADEAYKILDQ